VDPFRPSYDVLVVELWGAEDPRSLKKHRENYDTTWPDEVEPVPRSVPPVARYAEVPQEARAALDSRPVDKKALAAAWPASKWLVDGRPIEWLVSSELTYNNYEKPRKRERFPGRAAFYDDLKAHYDCWQWSPAEGGATGPTIRVYDLRTRVRGKPAVRDMTPPGS
jgi:hypothetical protein